MTTPAHEITVEEIFESQEQTGFRSFLAEVRRWPIIPIFILSLVVICAIFADLIAPNERDKQDLRARTSAPFWKAECGVEPDGRKQTPTFDNCRTGGNKYLLGADPLGRGLLTRIIHGARISLTLAAVSIAVGTIVGTTLGLMAGYFGGIIDEIIMRVTDIVTSIPYLLLALIIVIVLGQNFGVIVLVLALASWPGIVRLVRGQALQLRELDYVALAKVAGSSTFRILYSHILPGVSNTIVVATTLQVGSIILAEAILSFLGAGIPPPTPSWGSMVSDGRSYLNSAWWVAFFPGMAIFLTVMSFNFIGDWLRDKWDPRLRQL
tara:strand:- start:172 stop:1137 length:966 start_codon:yes stop_codon:yes gene_type:complete